MLEKGSSTIQRSAIYNVIPSAPVIDIFGPWTMVKGRPFSEDIIIRNNPTTVVVSGHWFFLDYEGTSDGVKVFGEIPSDAELTIDEGMITCIASNNGGPDSRSGVVTIEEVFLGDYRLDDATSNPIGLTRLGNYFWVLQQVSNNIPRQYQFHAYDLDWNYTPSENSAIITLPANSNDNLLKLAASETFLYTLHYDIGGGSFNSVKIDRYNTSGCSSNTI